MDLNKLVKIGTLPVLAIAVIGTVGDLLSPGIIALVAVPLELAVIFYFGYMFAKAKHSTVQCAVASAVLAAIGILFNAILLTVVVLLANMAGMYPGLQADLWLAVVAANALFAIPLFAAAGLVIGTIAELIAKRK